MQDNHVTQIHQAQVAAVQEAMPMLAQVAEYSPELLEGRTAIISPAVLFEAVQIQPERQGSGGRCALTIEFAAHCILSTKTEHVQLEIRNFAVRLLQVINQNRWGLVYAQHPMELTAFPSTFSAALGFESWIVSWEQTFHLGEVKLGKDWLPTKVYLGEAPTVGKAHQSDYQLVVTKANSNNP